jgi:hypothetical protein
MVVGAAHCPGAGLNEYVVVPVRVVFIVGGLQVPVIGGVFLELVGNAGGGAFRHNGPIGMKVGVICETMLTVMKVVRAH